MGPGGQKTGAAPPVAPGASLRLLGGFSIRCGERLLRPAPVQQRLLALLALHGGIASRPSVAGTLWPAASPQAAAGRLRTARYRVARLAACLVDDHDGGLSLGSDVGSDVADLEAWAGGATTIPDPAADIGEPGGGASLLPGWDEDWVLLHRERLRQLRLQALEALTVRLLAVGRVDAAVRAGRTAVAAEPLRESAHRHLARALAAADGPAAASVQYGEYAAALAAALGLRPSARFDKLLAALGWPPSRNGDAAVTEAG